MFVRELRVRGFKSFSASQETVVSFSPHVNLVVGRNGAGKSNCFEALHFVLLAPAASENLRLHLLHNASDEVAAHREAVVEVVLDNKERRLPFDLDEVRVQRRITDRLDQLKVNDRLVPKNKMLAMMESAGFSRSNPFFIVKQGQVAELATCTNARRLEVVLELAGVSVYELKARQSQSMLSESGRLFEEMADVLADMAKDIEQVDALKEKYKEVLELEEKKKLVARVITEKELHAVKAKILAIDEELKVRGETFEDGKRELQVLAHRMDQLEEEIANSRESERQLSQVRESILLEMEDLETKLARAETKLESRKSTGANIVEEFQMLNEKHSILRNDVNKGKKNEMELVKKIQKLQNEVTSAEINLLRNEDELSRLHSGKAFSEQDKALVKSEVGDLKRHLENYDTSIKELQRYLEEKTVEVKDIANKGEELDAEIATHESQIEECKEAIKQHRDQLRVLERAGQTLDNEEYDIHQKEMEVSNRYSEIRKRILVQQMFKSAFIGIESIKSVASNLGYKGLTIVGELLLETSANLDLALSVYLGRRLFFCVVPEAKDATYLLAKMKEMNLPGEVTFIAKDKIFAKRKNRQLSSEEQKVAKPLLEVVKFSTDQEELMLWLFGDALLVENEAAFPLFRGRQCITYDGSEAQRCGVMSGGHQGNRRSAFTLFRLMCENDDSKRKLKMKLADLRLNRESKMKEVESASKSLARLQIKREKMDVTVVDFQSKRAHLREERNVLDRLTITLQSELSAKMNEVARLRTMLNDKEAFLAGATSEELSQTTREHRVQMLVRENEMLRAKIKGEFKKKLSLDKKLNVYIVRIESLSRELDEVESQLKHQKEEEEKAFLSSQSPSQLHDFVSVERTTLTSLKSKLELITRQLDQHVQERVTIKEPELEALRGEQRSQTTTLQKVFDSYEYLNEQVEYFQMRLNTLRGKLGSGDSRLNREDLAQFQSYSSKRLYSLLEQIERKIEELPQCGQLSISLMESKREELVQFKERSKKLESDKEELSNLISDTNFSKVEKVNFILQQCNRYFSQTFSELVPNGRGKVVVESDSNGEPIGLAFRVTFDDTQTQLKELQMLSGGQRSIVAIAFMFALQKCDPCPFYVLDEIDAALDQQRRERVAALIAKQKETQFICTTFRPELLQVGDNFVAMKYKKKVSHALSVDQQQAHDFVVDADCQ